MGPASVKAEERTITPALACGMTQADGFLCLWHHKHNALLSDGNDPARHSVVRVGLTEQKRRWRWTGVVQLFLLEKSDCHERLGPTGAPKVWNLRRTAPKVAAIPESG
jgi:hypothetical protein